MDDMRIGAAQTTPFLHSLPRRRFLTLSAAAGVAATAAACTVTSGGSGAGGGNPIPKAKTPKLPSGVSWPTTVNEPKTQVTLSTANAWDPETWELQKLFDQDFMKRHPNIKIEAENTPFADYVTKYSTQGSAHTLPDIMYAQFSMIQQFISSGWVRPLDDYISKQPDLDLNDFTAASLGFYRHANKLWALPYDNGPMILFYNRNIFDAARESYPDSSWTLTDVKNAARKLAGGTGTKRRFGLYFTESGAGIPSPGDGALGSYALMPFGARNINNAQTMCSLDKPSSVSAMTGWGDLLTKYGVVPGYKEMQGFPGSDPFSAGQCAMAPGGSWQTRVYKVNSKFKWGATIWPRGPKAHTTFGIGSAYFISRDSKNPDAAWTYLNDYMSVAGQWFVWAANGLATPVRKSVIPLAIKQYGALYGQDVASAVEESLNSGIMTYKDILYRPGSPEITTAAGSIWEKVLLQKLSVEDGCRQVAAAINPMLAKQTSY